MPSRSELDIWSYSCVHFRTPDGQPWTGIICPTVSGWVRNSVRMARKQKLGHKRGCGTGCCQCPVPCRQSPSFEKAAYDLYHQQALSEWGKVLHNEDLAAAILDRVLERGRFIQLDGPSGRTRHLNLEGVWPATAERLRFSGINGSEFLKPTVINPHTAVEQPHT